MPEPADVAAYLSLLGYDAPPPPTLATLYDLHSRHLAAVPYENLDIVEGRPPSVAPSDSLRRIATTGRAGYCFHHNAALEIVLRSLGYDVARRHGFVWSRERREPELNHLVLIVTVDGVRHWVDVGLGDGPRLPLVLAEGEVRQDGFTFGLERTESGWTLRHDPSGSFTACEMSEREVTDEEIEVSHRRLSTPPSGRFTGLSIVQRRTASGAFILRNHHHIEVTPSERRERLVEYDEWSRLLAGCGLGAPSRATYDRLRASDEAYHAGPALPAASERGPVPVLEEPAGDGNA